MSSLLHPIHSFQPTNANDTLCSGSIVLTFELAATLASFLVHLVKSGVDSLTAEAIDAPASPSSVVMQPSLLWLLGHLFKPRALWTHGLGRILCTEYFSF